MQKPSTVVSSTRKKQVGAVTSAEQGILVTTVAAISANGSFLPPFYVFPRVRWYPAFLHGAPPGSAGSAFQTGWINAEIFSEQYMPFSIKNTRCSKDKPVLLIMDNHCSHVSLEVVNTARENGGGYCNSTTTYLPQAAAAGSDSIWSNESFFQPSYGRLVEIQPWTNHFYLRTWFVDRSGI